MLSLSTHKTLDQWIAHIETLATESVVFGLERMQSIATCLDLHFSIPVVTVTGTNGKGSTVGFIQKALCTAGYHVGCYTSPHLCIYNERILLDDKAISDGDLICALEYIESIRGDLLLTPFEYLTAAALWYFKQQPLDVLVLEVGCGGRLDAVNIVSPAIAVLTCVDLDHMAWLGENREAIGREKSGIFRPGIPVVVGERQAPHSVLDRAKHLDCEVYQLSEHFDVEYSTAQKKYFFYTDQDRLSTPSLKIKPENAATALMVLSILKKKYAIQCSGLETLLLNFSMPCRYQIFQVAGHPVILDVAHNPQAIAYLNSRLHEDFPNVAKHAIFATLKDKDYLRSALEVRSTFVDWYLVDTEGSRGLDRSILVEQFSAILTVPCYGVSDASSVFEQLIAVQNKDLVVVFGSFQVVGKIFSFLKRL